MKLLKRLLRDDKEFVKKGDEFFINCDYESSLSMYERALDINNDNQIAKEGIEKIKKICELRYRGMILFDKSKYNDAMIKFSEILRINPNDIKAKEYIDKIN